MSIDGIEPEKPSLPSPAETVEKADRTNQAVSNETSALRLSADLGLSQARRRKGQFEESISVMEVGKAIFTEKTTAQTASETRRWNNAES